MSGTQPIRVFAVFVLCTTTVMACGCKNKQEHPASPEATTTLTKDQLADAVAAHVRKESDRTEGFFIVNDEKTGEELKLTLDKVHRDRLSRVGMDRYFACADFTADTGKTYDLDVFMVGTTKDNLVFSDFSVHKEDGKERYTWHEKDGMWFKKPVGEETGKAPAEHPNEHPAEHPR